VPLVGCLVVLANEAEYAIKQISLLRAMESLCCLEYYREHDAALAALGRHIPERLCKHGEIQKALARTTAWTLALRMLCAVVGSVPLGWAADRWGRKPVLVAHKLNVAWSALMQLGICKWEAVP
jgi:hypothetical protein